MEAADELARTVAVVTGASRGIGRTIAVRLGRGGATVCLIARTERDIGEVAAGIEAAGGRARSIAADVTDRGAVERAFATAQELGPISLLVNNAGTLNAIGPLWESDPDVWWRDLEIHVQGTLLWSRLALAGMVERGEGRVVNVVGMLGQRGEPYSSAYACAKAAMFRMTDCLAAELEGTGVHVFCISPGPVMTDMTRQFIESEKARRWIPDFSAMAEDEWMAPDVGAELVFRLARGDADALTGRYIHVHHDLDELIANADRIKESRRLLLRMNE